MKTKFYAFIIFCAGVLFSGHANAQCGMRYVDSLFQVSITTVTYDVYDSLMDIYQPVGDTSTSRPVIVLAHEGTFDSENKSDDPTIVRLCHNYATRGFVVASINYRLMSQSVLLGTIANPSDSGAIITEVIQALSDGKAAVRYFSTDAATANLYKIDTTKMFIGGNSAGAVLAMHYGYIDSVGQVTPYLQGVINANGGIEGNSGNPGHTSKVAGVISLAGGLNDPEWVTPGDVPSFNAQGTADNVVPYVCGEPFGYLPVRLCGLGSLQSYYDSAHINEASLVFQNAPHVPWDADAGDFFSVDSALDVFMTTNFVTPAPFCGLPSGIQQVATAANEINLYPNPATSLVNVYSTLPFSSISIYDETGRLVSLTGNLNSLTYQLNTTSFSKGVYFAKFEMNNSVGTVVKRIVIE